jgi:hypothetical protein
VVPRHLQKRRKSVCCVRSGVHPLDDRREREAIVGGLAPCLFHERADLCFVGGGQVLQRERCRPHLSFVESRLCASFFAFFFSAIKFADLGESLWEPADISGHLALRLRSKKAYAR